MPRGFPLCPEAFLGTGIEGHFLFRQGFLQRLRIHIPKHQHFARRHVLHNNGEEVVDFLPVDFLFFHLYSYSKYQVLSQ